jgi:dipeptidyl aminopeptidase/acylaminoacyl peptidase
MERQLMERKRTQPVALVLALLAVTLVSACAARTTAEVQGCAWQIKSTRPASADDTAFVDRNPLLADPADAKDTPGPGSLRLLNIRTAPRIYGIYLYDTATGDSTLLAKRGSLPRFSPDGRYVSYTLWKSIDEPWNLVILDRKTGRSLEPALGGCVTSYRRWSPDSRWLAIQATVCKTAKTRLVLVSLPSGVIHVIDSLAVFGEYEFAWSPTSGVLAVIRPEAVDRVTESTSAADLWMLSVPDGKRCLLAATPGAVESNPQWVTDRSLLVTRSSEGPESIHRFLVQLSGGWP